MQRGDDQEGQEDVHKHWTFSCLSGLSPSAPPQTFPTSKCQHLQILSSVLQLS